MWNTALDIAWKLGGISEIQHQWFKAGVVDIFPGIAHRITRELHALTLQPHVQ